MLLLEPRPMAVSSFPGQASLSKSMEGLPQPQPGCPASGSYITRTAVQGLASQSRECEESAKHCGEYRAERKIHTHCPLQSRERARRLLSGQPWADRGLVCFTSQTRCSSSLIRPPFCLRSLKSQTQGIRATKGRVALGQSEVRTEVLQPFLLSFSPMRS